MNFKEDKIDYVERDKLMNTLKYDNINFDSDNEN